jgi:RNA polymerase sigma factor (sigma-70 family)
MQPMPSAAPISNEQDRRISEAVEQEQGRLRNFIRRRVPDEGDAEDILQDVFSELVESYRLMQPIEHVTAWLYRVARNRITDLFRKHRPVTIESNQLVRWEDLLPARDGGPEAEYARGILLDELEAALAELPAEQRQVFLAHEFEGRSFPEMAAARGVSVNTLLARKRYAVLHLRERLRAIYHEFNGR